jgi:hypothetical protein
MSCRWKKRDSELRLECDAVGALQQFLLPGGWEAERACAIGDPQGDVSGPSPA